METEINSCHGKPSEVDIYNEARRLYGDFKKASPDVRGSARREAFDACIKTAYYNLCAEPLGTLDEVSRDVKSIFGKKNKGRQGQHPISVRNDNNPSTPLPSNYQIRIKGAYARQKQLERELKLCCREEL